MSLILIAAGGTGGHMFPARAFAEALIARGHDVVLVTDPRGERYTADFPARRTLILPVANADVGGIIGKLRAAVGHVRSLAAASGFIAAEQPALIVGFGGYPSFPALAAAGRRPILIHEQNAVLGRVNRLFQGRAAAVASGFARLERLHPNAKAKHVVVGNPVRAPIVAAREAVFCPPAGDGPLHVLVTGGSQGARMLGDAVPAAIAALPEALRLSLHVTHQVREEQLDAAREAYGDAGVKADIAPFFKDMAGLLAQSHLVIGRSGASTVSEVAVVGRPSILVPLAIATNDHQTENARALADVGAADVIAERDLSVAGLTALLERRLSSWGDLQARAVAARAVGKPDAADALAALAIRLIKD
jgi:UDP-N-acetylglucosamine--N-acetylmuramyl-(pentapeptide) pyrophosphoryl-undecaprenol N-acetylglucosamine transferase